MHSTVTNTSNESSYKCKPNEKKRLKALTNKKTNHENFSI
jgi:hypothetical protein